MYTGKHYVTLKVKAGPGGRGIYGYDLPGPSVRQLLSTVHRQCVHPGESRQTRLPKLMILSSLLTIIRLATREVAPGG